MLKRFEVKNYKNFKDTIVIDFDKTGGYQFNKECIANDSIHKMIVYGRNATGKTNLGNALLDITFNTLNNLRVNDLKTQYVNADAEEKFATFKYVFQFDEDEIIYTYQKKSELQLYTEALYVNGKNIFSYNFETYKGVFEDLNIIGIDTVNVDRYLESMSTEQDDTDEMRTLSFLRWIINNTALKSGSVLLKIDDYIKRMSMIIEGSRRRLFPARFYESFFQDLQQDEKLEDFEEFLNVMGIHCKLILKTLPDGEVKLYFKHKTLVPFIETASSGTISLMNLYRRLFSGKEPSFLFMDEFDAFFHYEMAENVIRFLLEKYPRTQIIMTTHNTNLMTNRLLRPDCLFILSRRGALTALNDATKRELREGHNLEKMYISGEFDDYE